MEQESGENGGYRRLAQLGGETKAGDKNFRHQLKMLWPRMVEKTARRNPTTIPLEPVSGQGQALGQRHEDESDGTGPVHQVGINGGGSRGTGDSSNQGVDRHRYGGPEGQGNPRRDGSPGRRQSEKAMSMLPPG